MKVVCQVDAETGERIVISTKPKKGWFDLEFRFYDVFPTLAQVPCAMEFIGEAIRVALAMKFRIKETCNAIDWREKS